MHATVAFILVAASLRTVKAAAAVEISSSNPLLEIPDQLKGFKSFSMWPAQPPPTDGPQDNILNINSTCDLLPISKDACRKLDLVLKEVTDPIDCGDGTFCTMSSCGKWGGKEGMCCTGILLSDFEDWIKQLEGMSVNKLEDLDIDPIISLIKSVKNACMPFKEVLSERNIQGSREPSHEGCDDFSASSISSSSISGSTIELPKTYPVGERFEELLQGDRPPVPSCCRLDEDSVTIGTLENQYIFKTDRAFCVPRSSSREMRTINKTENDRFGSDSDSTESSSRLPGATANSNVIKPGLMLSVAMSARIIVIMLWELIVVAL